MKKSLSLLLILCMIVVGQPCRAHAAEWDEEAEEGGFFCENGIGLFSMEGIAGSGVCAADDLLLYGVLL